MKKFVFVPIIAALVCAFLPAQEELKGSLYFDDGTPGRVSYVDMAVRGKPGMKMDRAVTGPPYRERIIVTQTDIDYATAQISLDGVVTRDDDGNVIIVISATHRRIITPSGEITEVFEKPEEFAAFFFNYTDKYPKVVRATGSKGEKKPYLAVSLKKGTPARIYMRVIPYEEICVIESVNYPIKGCAYREVRATESFVRKYPNAAYLENTRAGGAFLPVAAAPVRPVENGYFSFMQGAGSGNFNNRINVYEEQVREMKSGQDISQITASEMERLFDGSQLNAEIIVGQGDAVSTATYEKMK
jgi:hypothetical protein